jgi:hypothetical protein
MTECLEYQRVEADPVKVRVLPDGRMTRRDASVYLGLSNDTLRTWASQWSANRKGPRPIKVGGRIFYLKADCDAFIRAGVRPGTNEGR